MCQYHSFSLWLQVMKDLLKFPQLPVTSYTFSSIVSMWSHHHYLSMASRNERLIKVSTVTSYQLHHFLPLPCHYASQSSITLWLQVMKDLLKFPQLPVTSFTLSSLYLAVMSPIIYYSLASRNVRLTTIPTVTSYLTTLVSRCVSITLSLSGFK